MKLRMAFLLAGAVSAGTVCAPAQAGESPYQGPAPSAQHLFCTAARSAHELPDETIAPAAVYFSGAFDTMAQNLRPVMDGYLAYLKTTYAFEPEPGQPNPIACTGVPSHDQAAELLKIRVDQAKKRGGNVVETGWMPAS